MKVNVQSVNFDADIKLIEFIQKRLDKLEQYYNKIISADVYLKVQKTSNKENKITEVRLFVPGDDMVATKTCKTFEQCIDECAAALERQLKRRKEKLISH
ncbi:ribosome hibernation protein YhbH [Nonlabens tegetincola]|uniref:Ribosome hibernation protein YhbH n=1 Tax=Nonlabens tegetincola TaxID=323273 RepID=A0A2S7T356_9FLAO|nr:MULTISPECIES: ribosome-associated translation inhibitor RaiA [Nonlabens]ALM21457.1 RNA polymerase subunit sigma-54 [Nonlabens sp. MIC269]ARN71826.1 ribosomal subunit interface protein [Nonlabens tegetincola]PQJ13204.1 ribosomal subunit interface protein [Nonlabens tegetincola]PQJ19559.1 ribosomal subunit interface protein [Nonlabens tegetincola]PQJ20564.1 ribosomal subunit interface protein [Nonlabens tegetincola]